MKNLTAKEKLERERLELLHDLEVAVRIDELTSSMPEVRPILAALHENRIKRLSEAA